MKPQFAGMRDGPGQIKPNHVDRQYAAAVFEQVHDRPPLGGREPIPVMVGGVVIPDGRVEAAGSGGKIAVRLIGQLIPFYVQSEAVRRVRPEDNFGQKAQSIGKLRGQEEVKFTSLKAGMRRSDRIAARSASTVDDGKHQGVGNRPHAKIEVEESSEFHHRAAGDRHAVAAHVGIRLRDGNRLRHRGRRGSRGRPLCRGCRSGGSGCRCSGLRRLQFGHFRFQFL